MEKSHCSTKSMPIPVEVKCLGCGAELEIWSDESDALCRRCGKELPMPIPAHK